MQARLLVFDPDIKGRRLIRTALSGLDIELSLILRATGKTAAHTLNTMALDGILLGLPADLSELIPIITQLQSVDHCPPIFFLHSKPKQEEPRLTKDEEGFSKLREILGPELRAYKLRRATSSLSTFFGQGEGSARSQLASQITDLLAQQDISAMYVSVDPNESRWKLRGSNFPTSVNSAIIALTDAHGGVAPEHEGHSSPLRKLQTGSIEEYVFNPAELLAMLIPNADAQTLKELEAALDVGSICVVPVHTQARLNGFLLLGITPEGREREALRQLAGQFGILLTKAEEYDLLNQQARSLRALHEVMLSLSATLDPSDLLDTVLEKLERVVPFDLASIALFEQGKLRVEASRGDAVDVDAMQQINAQTGEFLKIINRIISYGKPVHLDTVGKGGRQELVEQESAYESWMGVPISWGADRLGYLFLASKQTSVFEAMHLEISIGFARQLAIALQNAYLLQGSRLRAEKLKLVNDIGRYAISVLDPQQLVEEVATRVYEVFDYHAVRILLVEGGELVPYALGSGTNDLSSDPRRVIALEEVQEISRAVQQDLPVYLDAGSPRWQDVIPPQLEGAQAVVIIPLSIVSEVIGVMEVYAETKKSLGQEDIDILQVLAAQIAISVVNAKLFNEIRSHAVKLESRVVRRTEELQSQKERTEAILTSVADAVLVLDLNGDVVLTNPPAEELLRGEQGKALHESLRKLFVAEGVVQSGVGIGEVTYQALASPVKFGGESQGTVFVLRDITRLKELDRLKSQFVATVSHELRTPLTNIKLYLSLLRNVGDDKRPRFHKVLVRETERLSDMIEDLLNLSRLEAQGVLDKVDVSLVDLLQLVADNHEPACVSKGVAFSTDFSIEPCILADRTQIIQVFTNLLANAIAYTPVGGEISMRIAPTEQIESREYAKVVLRDTGIGIRKIDLPHIFDRFYRGSEAQKYQAQGSGLGLAIVREILDNHDAKVAVDSQPEEGTKFTVWLPTVGK